MFHILRQLDGMLDEVVEQQSVLQQLNSGISLTAAG
jgi:hypothetical protein